MRAAALATIAFFVATSTEAKASDLFTAFRQVCSNAEAGPSDIAATATREGWRFADPKQFPEVTSHAIAVSPSAIGLTKQTPGGTVNLIADEFPAPFPTDGKLIHLKTCTMSIPALQPDIVQDIKAWVGPEVGERAHASGKLTTFMMLHRDGKFLPMPDEMQPSRENFLSSANLVIREDVEPQPKTSLTYFVIAP